MTDFATVDDVNSRLLGRDLTDEERAKVPFLLADASAIMREAVPGLDLPPGPPATAVAVCCAMVLRVIQNPEGKRSEQIDDYSYTIDSARSAGQLYLTEEERAMLRPPRSSAFTIVPGAPVPAT